ncbi:HNH endonuclease [Frankia sp. CNm7]|uniref:HNH endonuclease n=1 Tax=Frankia nepalensis TaxID=1836974 RepID=A0A937UN27_9ACTN|nr:HNH endonuclease [Frankia nepalensis]MBL7497326.1 HNH endonuclease [Frankia nepalensis]MBL7509717.1 HNH endonuclease [Frankia nepalensis]MBL7516935.1 HNH endonuclease [Frankia nepalensis]MBL7629444.1 HNH endonuclease [Frankia nepalensis]
MRTLGDYLELSNEAVDEQWAQILARSPLPPGKRQEDFTPIEALLCFFGSLVVNASRYGSTTAHKAPTPVPELAVLFRRPPSSVLSKMSNLSGAWAHGAKYEVAVSTNLLTDRGLAESLYQRILESARAHGVSELDLPDFIGSELAILDQSQVSDTEIAQAANESTQTSGATDTGDKTTQATREVAVRIGQFKFARSVLINYGYRCAFCGFSPGPGLAGRRLLRASHIKPWRASTNAERVDVANGLAACPNHDAAFDTGLLHVEDNLIIGISPALRSSMAANPILAAAFTPPMLAETLILPERATRPAIRYLTWHRLNLAASDPEAV